MKIFLALILAVGLLPASGLAAPAYWEMSLPKVEKLAEKGDLDAIFHLQRPTIFDKKQKKDVPRPLEERLVWMRKGAELGDYRMQINLAHYLLKPPAGTAPDPAAAEVWLAKAVEGATYSGGMSDPGFQYRKEGGLMLERARLLQRQPAAEAGAADAMFDMAKAHAPLKVFVNWELGDAAEHRRWLELAAANGHPEAVLQLAKTSPTLEEKLKWHRVAAGAGNVESMVLLGHRAQSEQKRAEARQWFAQAAAAGHADAAYRFAGYLKTDKDTTGAIDWYRKAAAAGHKDAAIELARLADPVLARLVAAADKGDAEAAFQLGEHYRREGELYRAASAYSHASSLNHLEARYQYALLQHKDPAQQRKLMEQAAGRGHAGAQAWVSRQAGQAAVAARQQQQAAQDAERRAFVARIDREGTTDKLEVEIYCQYGGSRCNALRGLAQRAEQSRNQQVEAANRQRIQNIHSDGKTAAQRDAEQRARSECMRRKTESIQRSNTGQQDWRFTGDC